MTARRRNGASKEVRLPKLLVEAAFEPSTVDPETRTAEVRWYSGAAVERVSLMDGPFLLSMSMDPDHVRLDRLASGNAPLKGGHVPNSDISGVFGVIEEAWLARDGGHARVRFSKRPEVEPFFQDVQDGILRSVSMEAAIFEAEEITKKGAAEPHFLATDWEPRAVALVAVGADPKAVALSDESERVPCTVHLSAAASPGAPSKAGKGSAKSEETIMQIKVRLLADCELGKQGEIVEIDEESFDVKLHSKDLDPKPEPKPAAPTTVDAKAEDRALQDAIDEDKKRAERIKSAAKHFNLDQVWAQRHIHLGTSIDQVLADAADERAKRAPHIDNRVDMGDDFESSAWRVEQMSDALAHRAMRQAVPEPAKQYEGAGFVECAIECLGFVGKHRGLDPRMHRERIIEMALHTTSDFPLLLKNVLNKMLLPAYQSAQPTYRMIASQRTFRDFRPHRFMRQGDFPVPLKVNEHGEFKYGTMGENEEVVSAATYGRILGLSRQVLINDDLGAFQDLAGMAGRRLADFENAHFFTTVILPAAGLGPDLSDTNAVYDAAHSNLTAAGALDNDLLGEGFGLMQSQESLDGIKLNVIPRFLLTSPASATLARKLLTATTPASASDVNAFAGQITPISDANLTGTRFYLLADPAVLANYVYGFLDGSSGPRTQVREGFEVDGVEFKVALDFGVGAIDFRGGVTGAGA